MPAVVAEDVRRTYGDVVALDGASIEVEAGEVFGLIGPNGAGKTTLVRALTGTTDAEGRVELFGEDPTSLARDRLGLLPQSFEPAERLTARELVAYYGGLYDEARDPDAVLEDVGVADAADTRYGNLSGGQQRRVCVGTALVNDPEVLFLDEPTTGIDPAGRRTVWRLVEALADGGTTVLLTTHDMAEADRLADRVALLSAGRVVATGPPGELVAEHGGASRLEVETPDRAAAARAVEAAGYRAGGERRLAVRGVDPREIGEVVAALDDAGVDYGAVTWRQPDLEDAYLALTGTAVGAGGDPVAESDRTGGGDAATRPPARGEGA